MKFVHERARDAAPRLECNRRPPRSSEKFSGFAPRGSRLRRRKHRSYTRKYMHARNEHSTPRSTRAPRRSTQDASTCRSRRMQCMGPGSYNRRRPPTCSCAGPRARVMAREMGHAACERAAHTSKAAPHGARPALSHDSRPNLSCGEAPRSVAAAAPTSASKTMRDAADDMSCVKLYAVNVVKSRVSRRKIRVVLDGRVTIATRLQWLWSVSRRVCATVVM